MINVCTFAHGFEGLELPSHSRRKQFVSRAAGQPMRLVSDSLPVPIAIRVSDRPYRLSSDEHSLLQQALLNSVEIRTLLRRR